MAKSTKEYQGNEPTYRVDKEKGKYAVRKFVEFDHSFAVYSKPLDTFDTIHGAKEYIRLLELEEDELRAIADNTQSELDKIMDKIYDLAYDHLPERGIAIGTDRIKQSILDWHNKQVEEVLDRLETHYWLNDDIDTFISPEVETFIEAERAKLKEVK